jgi:hypothetical protein
MLCVFYALRLFPLSLRERVGVREYYSPGINVAQALPKALALALP